MLDDFGGKKLVSKISKKEYDRPSNISEIRKLYVWTILIVCVFIKGGILSNQIEFLSWPQYGYYTTYALYIVKPTLI